MVMRDGRLVFDWFGGFGNANRPHIAFSVSKSLAGLLVGILVEAGILDPEQQLTHYLPEIAGSAYEGASLRHLLDMTVASAFVEDYLDTSGVFMAYRRASAWNPVEEGHTTEGLRAFLAELPASDGNHGRRYHYCSTHTDLLGWVIERAAGGTVADLLSSHLFRPAGTRTEAYITLETYGHPPCWWYLSCACGSVATCRDGPLPGCAWWSSDCSGLVDRRFQSASGPLRHGNARRVAHACLIAAPIAANGTAPALLMMKSARLAFMASGSGSIRAVRSLSSAWPRMICQSTRN